MPSATTKKPAPNAVAMRPFEECGVFLAEGGELLGKPTRTLYEQAKKAKGPVWAYPNELTAGKWSGYPHEAAHEGDPEAVLVKVE